jgi:hypothetical protein
VSDVPNVSLRLLAALQRLLGTLVAFLLEGVDESGKFGASGVIIFMVLFGQGPPSVFFFKFGDS